MKKTTHGENIATYNRTNSSTPETLKDQAAELAEFAKAQGLVDLPSASLSFSEKLKQARKAAGLSQQGTADRMLIPKRTIEKWETGERTPPEYVQRFVLNELELLIASREANDPQDKP